VWDKVYIIGVGEGGGIDPRYRPLANEAEIVFGSQRLFSYFPELTGERFAIRGNLTEVVESIRANLGRRKVVVLASGDPNFYGIARHLVTALGKEKVEIIPSVSAMQLAFARIKESWDDAAFISVHGRPMEGIMEVVHSNRKVGIFTDAEHTPAEIAKFLLSHGLKDYQAYVCENLGGEQERVIQADLSTLATMNFSLLNFLILISTASPHTWSPGIPDEELFTLRGGLITKMEIRAVSLAKLAVREDSIIWDIGAGSGAVSIEAALIARKGRVYAIEKDVKNIALIEKNIEKFGTHNVEVIHQIAPQGLSDLPDPMAVFIGGSGGKLEEILTVVCCRLRPQGRIVINLVTTDNLSIALNYLKTRGFTTEVALVNVARSKQIANLTRFEALNPVFIACARRVED